MNKKFIEFMKRNGLSENTYNSYASDVRIFKKYYLDSYGEELTTLVHADVSMYSSLHLHILRLYFCSNALHNAGYSIEQVANQAGHSSLNTTKGYLVTEQEDLVSLANKL